MEQRDENRRAERNGGRRISFRLLRRLSVARKPTGKYRNGSRYSRFGVAECQRRCSGRKECKERLEGDGRTWPRCAVPVALYRGWNRLDRRRRQDAPAMWQMKRERGTQHHVTARHIIGWLEDRHHSIAFIDYDAGAERCDSLPGKQRCPLLVGAV